MNRSNLLNSPFLLGFEHLERLLERTAKSAGDGYPPCNIEQLPGDSVGNDDDGSGAIRITLAVAGFALEEISVTVEDNQLVIRGKQSEAEDKRFLHRGIAARQFLRRFVLADGIEVKSAALENGLLKIDLIRPQVQPGVRVVEIKTGGIK
jgi:HSP20 family molecular chaperone IbpA